MNQPVVESIDIYGIGPDGEKVSWSSFLGPMYEAMIVVELTFDNGLVGIAGSTVYTEHEFDRSVVESASLMAPFLLGKGLFDIPKIYAECMSRYVPLKNVATSLFDIAMHDAKGKLLNLPIYKMLGQAQPKVRAYASSPLLEDNQQYIEYCHQMLAQGFNAIKIHPRCVFQEDYALVKALQAEFADQDIGWSLDVDANYNRQQALRMGRLLDKYEWDFFEEPLSDTDFEGYRYLSENLDIDIVAGGNAVPNLQLINQALQRGSWDRVRFDFTTIGGFTNGSRVMALSQAYGLKAEVQSWGYTLTQAANLHMMLSNSNCEYFEQAAPYEKYEVGAKQVFRPDSDGYISPTELPGLGVELDWDVLDPLVYFHRRFSR
ncbi:MULTISPECIES: mandelate racemase/muconate lactonizing enzyme family protein [Aliamphritea]|uniref:mandelate racemase/muconate lactonizing enzyme family protein n=1 Tax=Aliamphritea TaxID=3018276 RepID=UPI00196B4652|nr:MULTISPECIES: mandelate racemase/muconate lactonizing enzyme family protein [Aliamphritea]MBN3563786.1 mandelate racemase/muconate lactonizing enzyme family protein [Aliamphritea spongicola]